MYVCLQIEKEKNHVLILFLVCHLCSAWLYSEWNCDYKFVDILYNGPVFLNFWSLLYIWSLKGIKMKIL